MKDLHVPENNQESLEMPKVEDIVLEKIEIETEQNNEETQEKEAPTKESIIEALKLILEKDGKDITREEVNRLKINFNNLRKDEIEREREDFIEKGGNAEEFQPSHDALEQELLVIISDLKAKKTIWLEEREKELQANLETKEHIIEEIVSIAGDTDNVNRSFNRFKELAQQFRDTGDVSPEHATTIWKKFQDAEQRFYDQLKINQELRDYDFKKNLEIKKGIIEKAQELAKTVGTDIDNATATVNENIVQTFKSLQDLHEMWKITGPVAKELRDELWETFREATVTVNKAYQSFFEQRKANEKANEEAKRTLLDKVTAIDYDKLKSAKDWDTVTKEVIECQAQWKLIGFTPRKVNNQIFTEFRKACDNFFSKKSAFFNQLRDSQNENIQKKTALVERAQQLQDSTDWNATAKELTRLQAEWKKIGPAPRKINDELWERFHAACDKFFSNRKSVTQENQKKEIENLKKKEEILKKLVAVLDEEQDIKEQVEALQDEWRAIGYVPIKEKNRVANEYKDIVNKIRKKFNLSEMKASMEKFHKNIEEIAGDKDKLNRERDKLFRYLENKRSDLATYLNNMGFLKSKSKSGDGLLKDIEHKIQLIQGDITDLEERISLIDSKL